MSRHPGGDCCWEGEHSKLLRIYNLKTNSVFCPAFIFGKKSQKQIQMVKTVVDGIFTISNEQHSKPL